MLRYEFTYYGFLSITKPVLIDDIFQEVTYINKSGFGAWRHSDDNFNKDWIRVSNIFKRKIDNHYAYMLKY